MAAPIDERDFPRDQSIPRIQRLRWLRGQYSSQTTTGGEVWDSFGSFPQSTVDSDTSNTFEMPVDVEMSPGGPGIFPDGPHPSGQPFQASRRDLSMPRFSMTSTEAQHDDIESETGKWRPLHLWSATHDMVYAKLCYAVLLFKSPRKSNFVIFKGQRWHIDWSTGQMSRVQPPSYGEPEFWGPWQVLHTDNPRL